MSEVYPSYLRLLKNNELDQRAVDARAHLSICDVCALNCPIDRLSGKVGACKTGVKARVSSYAPHHFEEYPLSGWHGSGTIFFSRCNLHCQYCQNHTISQTDEGDLVDARELAEMMLQLQAYGCHNINFVSPSHVVPQIIAAVALAAREGLKVQLVYNTGGYDSLPMLKLLDGIIDIYMPDMKYGASAIALKYSRVPHYTESNHEAVLEMHRQVGDLVLDKNGLATHGLLIRHLVLPNYLAGTENVVKFIAQYISKDTYLNLMDQYHPAFKANQYPELSHHISGDEYLAAYRMAIDAGLHRLDKLVSSI